MVFIDRHQNGAIGDGEVHMARRDWLALFPWYQARRRDGRHIKPGLTKRGFDFQQHILVRVVRARRHLAQRMAGPDKAGNIVDMAVGVVVQETIAQPDHFVDTQRRADAGLDLVRRQVRIAVRVKQALARGQQPALAVGIDSPAARCPRQGCPRFSPHRRQPPWQRPAPRQTRQPPGPEHAPKRPG